VQHSGCAIYSSPSKSGVRKMPVSIMQAERKSIPLRSRQRQNSACTACGEHLITGTHQSIRAVRVHTRLCVLFCHIAHSVTVCKWCKPAQRARTQAGARVRAREKGKPQAVISLRLALRRSSHAVRHGSSAGAKASRALRQSRRLSEGGAAAQERERGWCAGEQNGPSQGRSRAR